MIASRVSHRTFNVRIRPVPGILKGAEGFASQQVNNQIFSQVVIETSQNIMSGGIGRRSIIIDQFIPIIGDQVRSLCQTVLKSLPKGVLKPVLKRADQ